MKWRYPQGSGWMSSAEDQAQGKAKLRDVLLQKPMSRSGREQADDDEEVYV